MLDVLFSFLCHLRKCVENPAIPFMPAENSGRLTSRNVGRLLFINANTV